MWKVGQDSDITVGNLLKLGTDNGAKIEIIDSSFLYLRLCKGMLVYRPEPKLSKPGLLNYQAESGAVNSCVDCAINITDSDFVQCNFNKELRSIKPLFDYVSGVRQAERLDSSGLTAGSVMTPLFQNFGAIINI